jgi:hypothetical protein
MFTMLLLLLLLLQSMSCSRWHRGCCNQCGSRATQK